VGVVPEAANGLFKARGNVLRDIWAGFLSSHRGFLSTPWEVQTVADSR
jgi:hypothetical protein